MDHKILVLPQNRHFSVPDGKNLLTALRDAGIFPDAPCNGNGTCGKCSVFLDGTKVLACQTQVTRDLTVALPQDDDLQVLSSGVAACAALDPAQTGALLAFDIGTTSVVCYLLDGSTGREIAKSSMVNPQTAFGADVISRIQAACKGALTPLTGQIREGMTSLIRQVCRDAKMKPQQIGVVSVVGNPAMQQLFLGISPENLAGVPFAPVLTEAKIVDCSDILPICDQAKLLIVPDISGYIGADTLGCVLATKIYKKEETTLLVDIGTNGEMVLGNRNRMIACSTAAGPALEGANIRFGMRGAEGAIDHVWLEADQFRFSVIGGGPAKGICGSGLIDAIAVALKLGLLNKRGRIQTPDRLFRLTEGIYLTQEDIRQVQLAKGAICAGITLMAQQLGIAIEDIQQVQLAGAFGTFLDPSNACRIGLLPPQLQGKIEAVGNAAGSGAKMLACDKKLLQTAQELTKKIEFLELASLPNFPITFARAMNFREEMP